jgi:hypothetical protein
MTDLSAAPAGPKLVASRHRPHRPITSADDRPMAFRLPPRVAADLEKRLADKAAERTLIGRLRKFLGRLSAAN